MRITPPWWRWFCPQTEGEEEGDSLQSQTACGLFPHLQFGNVGAMAITLCQSLGQNVGMRWNNARNAAGKAQHGQEGKGEIFR